VRDGYLEGCIHKVVVYTVGHPRGLVAGERGGAREAGRADGGCCAWRVQGGRMETKAKAAGRKNNRLKALRYRMVQQVQLLFNELDRHGGAERLVASASKGAGSADGAFGECDDCPGGVELLCETTLREMSLDEVCEALSAKGLDMYVGLFQRKVLDGTKLAELDEPALLALGLDR